MTGLSALAGTEHSAIDIPSMERWTHGMVPSDR